MAQTFQECFNNIHYLGKCAINGLARPFIAHGQCGKEAAWMAVNPVDAMTWKARELKISYGILLTQITEEERQEILEGSGTSGTATPKSTLAQASPKTSADEKSVLQRPGRKVKVTT